MRFFNTATRFHVLPIIFLQMFNYGIIRPSLPVIQLAFFENSYTKLSLTNGILDAIGAFLAFTTLPLFGIYSDLYGRRPVLVIKLVFITLPIVLLCFTPTISMWYFFIASILTKISTFSTVYAYVADVTAPEHRSAAYGQVSATVFLALTSGPLVAKFTTIHTSFVVAAIISFFNLFYSLFIIPESLVNLAQPIPQPISLDESDISGVTQTPKSSDQTESIGSNPSNISDEDEKESNDLENRIRPSTSHSRVPSGHVPTSTASHLTTSPLMTLQFMFRSPIYTVIFVMVFLEQCATYGIGEIFLLYMMKVLEFKRSDNINFLSVGGFISCFVMLILLPIVNRWIGEKKLILACILFYSFYSIMYLFVDQVWQAYALLIFGSLSTMSFPATGSLLSMYVPKDEMGLAQGALSGVRSLSLGVGPLIFSMVFAYFSRDELEEKHPAAPFALSFVLSMISFFIGLRIPDSPEEVRRKESTESIFAAVASIDDEPDPNASLLGWDEKLKA
jgi:MFS family permease